MRNPWIALRPIIDRQEIMDVLLRYARGVDRLDADLISSAYFSDAVDIRGHSQRRGDLVAAELLARLASEWDSTFHALSNIRIELKGDQAWAESYFQSWKQRTGDWGTHTLHVCGRYVDLLENRVGGWRIARREVLTDLVQEADGSSSDLAILGHRSKTDPSYTHWMGDASASTTSFNSRIGAIDDADPGPTLV